MGLNISRFTDIEISNKTQTITLKNPRTHFYSGRSLKFPDKLIAPNDSSTFRFTNSSWFWGSNGVLAFEAETFTLAIYFSNPIDYNRFSGEMGLELSRDKVHCGNLKDTYDRLVKLPRGSSDRNSSFRSAILKEDQQEVQVSDGPIKVTAKMHRSRNAIIQVEVEEQTSSGGKDREETSCRPRHVQEK